MHCGCSCGPHAPIHIHPIHSGELGHRVVVHGKVHPHDSLVRLFVFSHDGAWYKQQPATVQGTFWFAEVCLGFEHSTGSFDIIAAIGPVDGTVVKDVPAEVKSKPITVTRK